MEDDSNKAGRQGAFHQGEHSLGAPPNDRCSAVDAKFCAGPRICAASGSALACRSITGPLWSCHGPSIGAGEWRTVGWYTRATLEDSLDLVRNVESDVSSV